MESKKNYPAYKGEGVAVWINIDKNGKKYLTIKVLGNITLNAFKYEPKREDCSDI